MEPYPRQFLEHAKLIEPDAFCNGLLNFSPPDIRSLAAVRADPKIRQYGTKVGSLLGEPPSNEVERKILAAMAEAHRQSEAGERVEKIFEVASWVVKPLHYVPVVGEVVGFAEDMKDLAMKWLDREKSDQDWYLLAPKMTDIAIRDYFSRKSNLMTGQ